MTVVYVDSVFVLNALMDYLLVLCAARLAGIPLRRRRYLLAAPGWWGAYAVAVFLPGLRLSLRNAGEAGGRHTAWRWSAYGGEAKHAGKADAAAVRRSPVPWPGACWPWA